MIEQRVPLRIPPGLFMNGTEFEKAGRWSDGNMVRFFGPEGLPRPVEGQQAQTTQGIAMSPTDLYTFAFMWDDPPESSFTRQRIIVTTLTKVYYIDNLNSPWTVYDITPAGGGNLTNETMSAAVLGNTLLFTAASSASMSKLWKWGATTPVAVATEITNFTTQHGISARGVFVTPESFTVVLKGHKDVVWPSQGATSAWLPTSTNSAGGLTVPTDGDLVRGVVLGRESLLLSNVDLWSLEYVGGDLVYGVRNVGKNCGLHSPNLVASVHNTLYWMGNDGFFTYDGYVRDLPCDIWDWVKENLTLLGGNGFTSLHPEHNEIWWHLTDHTEFRPNVVVIYNYENQTWSKGTLERSAAAAGTRHAPMVGFNGTLYLKSDDLVAPDAFIECAVTPLSEDVDNRLVRVSKLIPDGGVADDWIELWTRRERGDAEEQTVVPLDGSGAPVDVRVTARYFRYKQLLRDPDSRVGVPELAIIPSSRR